MEKCIGCELCAGVCPARCIYVRGADNPPDDPVSPGERYGFVYEINYLRCIHCDLCVEACPTEAITESKLFEFSFTNRQDAIYTKAELVVDDDGLPAAAAVGGLVRPRRRRRQHLGLGAGHRARPATPTTMGKVGVVGRARLRREAARAGPVGARARRPTPSGRRRRARRRPRRRAPLMELFVFLVAGGRRASSARSAWCCNSNPVHAALSLVGTLFGIAVLFVAQEANFLAAVQVIVYAGAIVVLFLFVIMLLGVDRAEDLSIEPLGGGQRIAAVIVGLGHARAARCSPCWSTDGEATGAGPQPGDANAIDRGVADVNQLGESLFTDLPVRLRGHLACCSSSPWSAPSCWPAR